MTEQDVEAEARSLCSRDGIEPDWVVRHAYGDDFTSDEWVRFRPHGEMYDLVQSPMWRLYRNRAVVELCRKMRDVRYEGNVIPFRKPA